MSACARVWLAKFWLCDSDLSTRAPPNVLAMAAVVQLADVARFCNRYPNVSVSYEVENEGETVAPADNVAVTVKLEREDAEILDSAGLGVVYAPRYPKTKTENWWVIVGDPKANSCLAIKRVTLEKSLMVRERCSVHPAMCAITPAIHVLALCLHRCLCMGCSGQVKLEFPASESAGTHDYTLYFMSDSYMGCDQEYEFSVSVGGTARASGDMEDDE